MALQEAGKIRHYGVSNFDTEDMKQLTRVQGGKNVQTNQVLYNLSRRGIEWDLLPWLGEHHIPMMAYSPIEESRLLRFPELKDFAKRHEMKPAQAALGWLLSKGNVIVIPKTSRRERLVENLEALEHPLTPEQVAELNGLFPPPTGPEPLEMI